MGPTLDSWVIRNTAGTGSAGIRGKGGVSRFRCGEVEYKFCGSTDGAHWAKWDSASETWVAALAVRHLGTGETLPIRTGSIVDD